MFNRIKAWWAAEGAMVQLQGVSDRMLADMGLEREGLRERVAGKLDPGQPQPDCRCRTSARGPVPARRGSGSSDRPMQRGTA
ncbi:MAG: hypothetical protein ACK4GM_13975 [Tabrizicola sp.]